MHFSVIMYRNYKLLKMVHVSACLVMRVLLMYTVYLCVKLLPVVRNVCRDV